MPATGTAAFPALGTGAVVIAADRRGLDAARRAVEAEIDAIDRACSRFRSDSELEAVNRAGGRTVAVGRLLVEAVGVALDAAALTGGDVDPTVGEAIRVLGYDRDFRDVVTGRAGGGPPVVRVAPVPGWQLVRLDRAAGTVTVPAGVRLDLGATAKALAADRAARRAADEAGCGVLVSLGGDIATGGTAPRGGWAVRVTDWHAAGPDAPGETVTIHSGGLATSSTTVRRWDHDGEAMHHIVDPTTGRPADVVWRTVSVAAATCVVANVASTAAVVRGEPAAAWLESLALPARLVRADGTVVRVAGWPDDDNSVDASPRDGPMITAVVTGPSSKALWYLTRGTGIVSLVLLTASVVLGVTTSVRWENRAWPRWIIEGLHRNLSLLVVAFISIHVATTVVDGFAPIGWLDAVVPFRSPYRPIWLGLGALSLDMLLAIALTSIFRARLGHRVWRAVHWLAYACWPVALVHALGTGSDAREGWMVLLAAVSVVAVLAAVGWRLALAWPRRARGRWVALAAGLLFPIVLAAWAALGPLRPGWAKAAGTPVALAGQVEPTTPSGTGRAAAVQAFDATFDGTMTQSGGNDGAVTLNLQGGLAGGPFPAIDIQLNGQPLANGGGVSLRSGDVALGPAADPSAWQGRITGLRGGNITATVTDATGRALDLTIQVTISRATGSVHGTVNAIPAGN